MDDGHEDDARAGDARSGVISGDAAVPVTVRTRDGKTTTIRVPEGTNLRERLLAAGFAVYDPDAERADTGVCRGVAADSPGEPDGGDGRDAPD